MRKLVFFLVCLFIAVGGFFIFFSNDNTSTQTTSSVPSGSTRQAQNPQQITAIAQGLDTPWSLVFLPDQSLLVTERPGTVRLIDNNYNLIESPVAVISDVLEIGEGGLLGITIHPEFSANQYVYLYYTYSGDENATRNRVVRMRYENGSLSDEQIIVDRIPGAPNHNGGRIKFGPDNNLYIATGDAQEPSLAQDTNSLAGKILRVTDLGKPVADNLFNNLTFSYGHRNVQGLAWDSNGILWATEHGRSGVQSGLDELNRIEKGNNYGWPEIEGNETRNGMVTPVVNSGASETWAPAGAAISGDMLLFGGLRGQALYRGEIQNTDIESVEARFKNEYGRIRDVVIGPDGMLYVATSNRDGRGVPGETDDRILRINPEQL